MINIKIPKNKFWTKDYARLATGMEGAVIPLRYGNVQNISPICVDTVALRYKLADHAIKSIDAVRDGDIVLISGTDYIPNLATAEFSIVGSPFLSANTTYFLQIRATWGIDAVNYVYFVGRNDTTSLIWSGNASNVWTSIGFSAFRFAVYGKITIDASETAEPFLLYSPEEAYNTFNFKDDAARTKWAIKLAVGAVGFYISRVEITISIEGGKTCPTGNMVLGIFESTGGNPSNTQVGSESNAYAFAENTVLPAAISTPWTIRGAPSSLSVDIHGKPFGGEVIDNSIEVIEDIYCNNLLGSETDLNSSDFTALRAIKTEEVSINCDSEITFGELLSSIEKGQLFKVLPDLNGQYTVKQITSDSSSVKHFYDEDISDFKVIRDVKSLFKSIKITYGIDPTTREALTYEYVGDAPIASWLYGNEETLSLGVFLVNRSDVVALAQRYAHLCSVPRLCASFSVSEMMGFDLMPFQVIKITRTRAAYTNGVLSGTEFVILNLGKVAPSGTTTIFAVLKEHMY